MRAERTLCLASLWTVTLEALPPPEVLRSLCQARSTPIKVVAMVVPTEGGAREAAHHTTLTKSRGLRRTIVQPVWCEKAAEARSVLVESPK